jgi:hypothetical protein
MKFHQLANGQTFFYQNQSYTKISPVIATSNETGAQKFMRRADTVEVREESATKPDQQTRGVINKSVVLKIIDQSFKASLKQLEEPAIDSQAVTCKSIIMRLKDELSSRINAVSSVSNKIKDNKNR